MIRIGLVSTSWLHHRCGIAEYSRQLVENLVDSEIQIEPLFEPYHFESLHARILAGKYDIVHVMYEGGYVGIFSPGVATRFREAGAKLVVTVHDNWPRNDRECHPFVQEFDRIIVHQNMGDGYITIPSGIDLLDNSPWSPENVTIGTSGFPLWQKRVLEVAQAAAILVQETDRVTGCFLHCPESQHVDTFGMGRKAQEAFPGVRYATGWSNYKEAQREIASNLINVYPFLDGKPGISSSARMGIGTGSYTVLSRSTMFMDLWENPKYEEEIEWIEGDPADVTPRKIADACLRVIANGKRPKKILEDMSWKRVAYQHAELYKELVGVVA